MFFHSHRLRNLLISNELLIVFFFFTISFALTTGYRAAFLFETFGLTKSVIGAIALFQCIIILATSVIIPPVLERLHAKKLLNYGLILGIIFYFLIPFVETLFIYLFLLFFVAVSFMLRTLSFNIIYRDTTSSKTLNKKEGILFSFFNLTWFISPIIGLYFVDNFGVESIFFVASFTLLISFILYKSLDIKEVHTNKIKRFEKSEIKTHFLNYFKNPFYRNLYLTSSGIHIYWAYLTFFIVIMLENGYSASSAGLFFSATFLTLILNEYHATKLTDKYKFRTLFLLGYFISIFCLLVAFFVEFFFIKIIFVALSALGYSFIEPTREVLFFKKTPIKDEEKYYPIQVSCNYPGLIFGFLFFSLLFLTPIHPNYSLLILVLLLSIFLFFAAKIKD